MLNYRIVSCIAASMLAFSGTAFAAGGQNEELIGTDTESLISAYGEARGFDEYSTQDMTDIREFVGCFVSGLDLPREVYLQCGISIVQTATACGENIANPACLTSIVDTVGACKLPAKNIMDSVSSCMKEQQD